MSHVLDINDCPPHNVIYDIDMFPKYYDPVYHPYCHPKVFKTLMTVKKWIERAMNSHQGCHRYISKSIIQLLGNVVRCIFCCMLFSKWQAKAVYGVPKDVMIFTLHCTFPLFLPSTGSWVIFVHLFISFNYYLLLTQAQ